MKKLALLSVSDQTGLSDLASALHKAGYGLLATSGTGKALDWLAGDLVAGLAD